MKALAPLWLVVALSAAQPQNPPLDEIRAKMGRNLAQAPNYTCTQTIDRWSEGNLCRECEYRDRLRLEIAVIGNRERFSWPGADAFEDREILDMVGDMGRGGGMVLSGDFSSLARGVFVLPGVEYTAGAAATIAGRPVYQFLYTISAKRSGLIARIDGRQGAVGFRGSFWADAESLDVVRLTLEAVEIPPGLNLEKAEVATDYHRARIGESDFLLPATTESSTVTRTGVRSRNRTVYGGCRQYVGASTIRYGESGDAPAAEAPAASAPQPASVPAGLLLQAALAEPLDLKRCAIGDEVTFVVLTGARRGEFRAPKGALIRGRIAQCTVHIRPHPFFALALRTTTLESGGKRVPFPAQLESADEFPPRRGLPQFRIGRDGVLAVETIRFNIPKSFRFYWRTVSGEKP